MTDQLLCTYAIAAPNCKLVKYLNDFRDTTSYGLVTLVNTRKKVLNGPFTWHSAMASPFHQGFPCH
jgi:hypothetical protein